MAAPKGNKNAEKWTIEKAEILLLNAIKLSNQKENFTVNGKQIQGYSFDFIGEVARELDTYHEIITRDIPKRFPELKALTNKLIKNLETNCYSNTKKGLIREATGIVNLKSNHKWTDRIENENTNKSTIKIKHLK